MAITSSNPVTVAAQPEAVYNVWWVARLYVGSDDASKPTTASVVYRLGRIDSTSGNFVPYLDANGDFIDRLLQVDDLFALAATNTDVANLITQLLGVAGALGMGQNVIS